MGEDGSTGKKNPIDIKGLPDSVTALCDAMMKMDPNWSLLEWLDRRAMEELELAASHPVSYTHLTLPTKEEV